MANEEQVKILRQGVEVWNKWRKENPDAKINLVEANLKRANLRGANLREANLRKADFIEADLREVDFTYAHLMEAEFGLANLMESTLRNANLERTHLHLSVLVQSVFTNANLTQTDFYEATIGETIFANTDLSRALCLDTVHHEISSPISDDTLALSKGKIHEAFLRGCGLSDWAIESAKLYNPELTNEEIIKIQYKIYDLRATRAIQIAPLFISYSHADKLFVDYLDKAFTEKGVRFWRDIHDATAGRLETQIDRAIRQNPTVLLVLSKNSIKSDWVEHEVRKARELEKELGRDALCPIALDDGWKSSPWPKRVMEQVMEYNILDFSGWEDQSAFEGKFAKLLSGLDLFYKKAGSI